MIRTAATLLVLAGATSAQAGIFSFASDNDHQSFTFSGFGASVTDAQDSNDPFELLLDDANGPNNPLSYMVEFDADFAIRHVMSVNLGGGLFVHNYSLNGTFDFIDGSGNPLLSATVQNGALTALGGQSTWLSSASILGADGEGASVTYTWFGPDLPSYGVFTGQSIDPDDAAFTLTFLQSDGGAGVRLGSDLLPALDWVSEGSYSGSAQFVPAPGAVSLLAGAGLLAMRRRR